MAVTIKDVAAKCGLSISTVSKAFNNYADISAETRELVQRAAKEIGYYPNAIARTLKTNRSYNLGVLFQEEQGTGLTHSFFAAVLQNASLTTVVGQTTAGKAKYQQFFTLESDYSALKLTVGEYGLLNSETNWEGVGVTPEVTAELPPEQASMSGLLEPEDDQQVKVALQQISKSDMTLLENSSTSEPTEKPTEKETEKTSEKSTKKTTEKTTKKTTEKK